MNNFLRICVISSMIAFACSACDEGEFNDLDCDSATYTPNCIGNMNLLKCVDNKLVMEECGVDSVCISQTGGVGVCVPDASKPKPDTGDELLRCETEGATKCEGPTRVLVCRYHQWELQRTCGVRCENGQCTNDEDKSANYK